MHRFTNLIKRFIGYLIGFPIALMQNLIDIVGVFREFDTTLTNGAK